MFFETTDGFLDIIVDAFGYIFGLDPVGLQPLDQPVDQSLRLRFPHSLPPFYGSIINLLVYFCQLLFLTFWIIF